MWYYASGGQQLGPVDDAALDDLARQGVIRPDTLIWREGMPSWQPYSAVRGFAAGPPPAAGYGPPQPPYGQPSYGPPPPAYAPPAPVGPYFDFALWPTRALGALIDGAFVLVAMGVLYFFAFVVFGSMIGLGSATSDTISNLGGTACCCMIGLTPLASLLVGVYNKVYLLSTRGFSIGQGVVKVKVVDKQGNRLTQGTAFLRLLVQAGLSLIWIASVLDYLWPLWDERRQTLHDKAVDCYVINNPSGM